MTPSPTSPAATFVFADIAGFTTITEIHGDAEAAEIAEKFSDVVAPLLAEHDGKQIKTIGDALMLRVPDAAQAIRLGVRVAHEIMTGHLSPTVRVGMHHGAAVERGGDWFGAAVNLAARVAGEARGGEVLLTAATRDAAGAVPDVRLEPLGIRHLRNVEEPVELLRAAPHETRVPELPIDPVCRMAIDPGHCAGSLTHRGVTHHFCSLDCAARFARDPGRYTP